MYSEEIKYDMPYSEDISHLNKLRISYFENRSCLTNVLDFLDQEVVIIPSSYFSYSDGIHHLMEDVYMYTDTTENSDRWSDVYDSLCRLDCDKGYHLSVLDNYLTIIDNSYRCIFTNKYMLQDMEDNIEEVIIIGAIFWVNNFNELLKKYSDRNLKRISKAIVYPYTTKSSWRSTSELLDDEFFLSMDVYKPEIIFKYNIDTYMSNVCINVYNKLTKIGLNGLVDKYITTYKQCNGYGDEGEDEGYKTKLCKCGGIRAFCYLNI
jgi:hypothetical protein